MKITIDGGTFSQTFDADVILAGSTSTALSVDSSVVTISADAQWASEYEPVRTINEIKPTADGTFFLSGSECDSWTYLGGSTIGIVDLCPACKTCDAVYQLKHEIEELKLFLNSVKDANLYNSTVTTNRRALLTTAQLFKGTAACTVTPSSTVYPKGLELMQQYVTLVRMWNYVVSQNNASTVIDVAPEDTSGFTVQTKRSLPSCGCDSQIQCMIVIDYVGYIKDNTGGVLVQSKHPEYKEREVKTKVDGHIVTTRTLMNGLSIYTPEPIVTVTIDTVDIHGTTVATDYPTNTARRTAFKPFETKGFTAQPTEVFVGELIHPDTPEQRMISCSGCTYSTGWMGVHQDPDDLASPIKVRNAGTYAVYLKVLPFCGVEMYNKDDQIINIRDGVNLIEEEVSGGTDSTTYILEPSSVAFPCYNNGGVNATESQYLNSKCAPSVSVPYKNVWKIEVTWTVKREDEQLQTYSDTYYYTCTGVPLYYGDQVMTNSTIENKFIVTPTVVSGSTNA